MVMGGVGVVDNGICVWGTWLEETGKQVEAREEKAPKADDG